MLTIKTNWQQILRGFVLVILPLLILMLLPATISAQDANDIGNDCAGETAEKCIPSLPLVGKINDVVNAISALVGVIIVGAIIVGGIQYSAGGDNPQATGAAKKRITNAFIALLFFLLTYAFLQWLVPGGIFNS